MYLLTRILLIFQAFVFVTSAFGSSNGKFDGLSAGVEIDGALWSKENPFKGEMHLLGQPNSFKYSTYVNSPSDRSGFLLITCYIDPRGEELDVHFSLNEHSVSEHISSELIGYRQIAVKLPYMDQGLLVVTTNGKGKAFMLDEMNHSELNVVLPDRPNATQVLSNYKKASSDGFVSLALNNADIIENVKPSCDGYRLIEIQSENFSSGTVAEFTLTSPVEGKNYILLAWSDRNGDGHFTQDEQIVREKLQGDYTLQFRPDGVQLQGGGVLRFRLLDGSNSLDTDAISGNMWGETIDVLFKTDLQGTNSCRCSEPDYFMDLSGRKLLTLDGVPNGMYLKVSEHCTEKTLIVR